MVIMNVDTKETRRTAIPENIQEIRWKVQQVKHRSE